VSTILNAIPEELRRIEMFVEEFRVGAQP